MLMRFLPSCFTETQELWTTCLSITELIPSGSTRRLSPCLLRVSLWGASMERTACRTGLQKDRMSWLAGQTACSTWGQSQRLVLKENHWLSWRFLSPQETSFIRVPGILRPCKHFWSLDLGAFRFRNSNINLICLLCKFLELWIDILMSNCVPSMQCVS